MNNFSGNEVNYEQAVREQKDFEKIVSDLSFLTLEYDKRLNSLVQINSKLFGSEIQKGEVNDPNQVSDSFYSNVTNSIKRLNEIGNNMDSILAKLNNKI